MSNCKCCCKGGSKKGKEITPKTVHEVLEKYILADGYPMVVDMEKSHGSYMHDSRTGKEYLDFFSFFASMPLTYNRPEINNKDFIEKMGKLALHKPSNSDFYTVEYAEFIQAMADIAMPAYMKKMFFVDGGALAVENAMKTAFDWKIRKNFANGIKDEKGTKIIHFKQAFHGRTGYTLSLTNTADPRKTMYFPKFDWPRIDNPYLRFPITAEVLEDVKKKEQVAISQIEAVCAKDAVDIAGLVIEPIQGEGGDHHFRTEFMVELRRLADKYEFLLIFDEVQSGGGLTGKMWAHEHYGVQPDVICFGKKFQTCGIMVGDRVLSVEKNVFAEGSRINSTWGGNLVDMFRATKYLNIIKDENLLDHVVKMGKLLMTELEKLSQKTHKFNNVRGKGLFIAFDMKDKETRGEFLHKCMEDENLIILPCGDHSVRFRPFIDVEEKDIMEGLRRIENVLNKM